MRRREAEDLVRRSELRFQVEFLTMLRLVRSRNTLYRIRRLLESGRMEEAMSALESAASKMGSLWTRTFVESAGKVVGELASRNIVIGFDQVNERAVAAMRANTLRFVREMSEDTRRGLRQVMLDEIARGTNPVEQARIFRDSVGLTAHQARQVANYRRLLEQGHSSEALSRELRDRRFDSTVARGEPLSRQQIDRMVGRYRERMIARRAQTIARTESLRAVHEGIDEAWNQAVDLGEVDPNSLERKWLATPGTRTRDTHRAMNGQIRAFGEPFQSPSGALLDYPGDPKAPASETVNCRCTVVTRMVSLVGSDAPVSVAGISLP